MKFTIGRRSKYNYPKSVSESLAVACISRESYMVVWLTAALGKCLFDNLVTMASKCLETNVFEFPCS